MDRSYEIFEYIFKSNNNSYKLEYYSCPYITNNINLEKRIEKEKKSLDNFKNLIKTFKNPKDIHEWIYTKHDCYISNPKKKDIKLSNLLYC